MFDVNSCSSGHVGLLNRAHFIVLDEKLNFLQYFAPIQQPCRVALGRVTKQEEQTLGDFVTELYLTSFSSLENGETLELKPTHNRPAPG